MEAISGGTVLNGKITSEDDFSQTVNQFYYV